MPGPLAPTIGAAIPAIAAAVSTAGTLISTAMAPDEMDIINAQKQKTGAQKEAYASFLDRRKEQPLGSMQSPFSQAAENYALGSYNKEGTNFSNSTMGGGGDLQNKIAMLRQKAASKLGGNPFGNMG